MLPMMAFVVAPDAAPALRAQALMVKTIYGNLIQVCTGSDSIAKIDAALEAVVAVYGTGKVQLSGGHFPITRGDELVLGHADGLELVGMGHGTVLALQDGINPTSGSLVRTGGGKDNLRFADFVIDGNRANNDGLASNLVFTGGCGNVMAERIYSLDANGSAFKAIAVDGFAFLNCEARSTGLKGIEVSSSSVRNGRIEGNRVVRTDDGGIEVDDGASHVGIKTNYVATTNLGRPGAAISVHNHQGFDGPVDVRVMENQVFDARSKGIRVIHQGGFNPPSRVVLGFNHVQSAVQERIFVDPASSPHTTLISNS